MKDRAILYESARSILTKQLSDYEYFKRMGIRIPSELERETFDRWEELIAREDEEKLSVVRTKLQNEIRQLPAGSELSDLRKSGKEEGRDE